MTCARAILTRACTSGCGTLVVALGMLLHTAHAHALTDEDVFLAPLPTVLSASRLSQPLSEAPGAVTIINREAIRRSGARSIPELLRSVPGMQIGYRSGYYPLVTYHGLADSVPRRLMIRIDGRSAYYPYTVGGIQWHLLPIDLDDIERIEVFRGTNSATFGSQAVQGVIDIVTRGASDTPRLRIGTTLGDNGIRDHRASAGVQGERNALRISASREGDDGLEGLDDRYRRERAELRADIDLGSDQLLELQAGSVQLKGGIGFADDINNPVRTMRHGAEFAQARWSLHRGPDETLSVTVYRYEERLRDAYPVAAPPIPGFGIPSVVVDYHSNITRHDVEMVQHLAPVDGIRLVWGLGWREDTIRSVQYYHVPRIRGRNQRVFGNLEWRPAPRWLFNAGAMVEHDDRAQHSRTLTSPRLAVNYQPAPAHSLRAAVSRGYRLPALFEEYGDMRIYEQNTGILLRQAFQPATDLRPERFQVAEVGYHLDLRQHGLSGDVRMYHERVEHLIFSRNRQTPLTPVIPPGLALLHLNHPPVTLRGIELEGQWQATAHHQLGLSYGRHTARSEIDRASPSIPDHQISLLLGWTPSSKWEADLALHWTSDMSWFRSRPEEMLGESYRADLRVARRFDGQGYSGEFALVLRNLGNRVGAYNPTTQRTPRQTYATLRLEF